MATSTLLSTSAAPDLPTVDGLYRTFRTAASRGEGVSLFLLGKEGRVQLDFQLTAPSSNQAPTSPSPPARHPILPLFPKPLRQQEVLLLLLLPPPVTPTLCPPPPPPGGRLRLAGPCPCPCHPCPCPCP